MADLPIAGQNAALNAIVTTGTTYYLSLHTADPGLTGANELSGGSYARQAIIFAAASGGAKASTDAQSFTGLSGPPTVTFFGIWSASTSGTFECGGTCAPVTAAAITAAIGAISLGNA